MDRTLFWQNKAEKALRNRSETNDIDFKKDLSENQERLKDHINAFGNSPEGGLFVFGITRDFDFSEEKNDNEKIIETLTNLARDTQVPSLQTVVHHLKIEGTELLAIEILPGSNLPVFIRGRDIWSNGSFIRTGTSTRAMSEHEIRDSMATYRKKCLDEEPVDGATLKGLDLNSLGTYLTPFREEQGLSVSNMDILYDNKIVKAVGPRSVPTLAGWMMFANNPQSLREMKNTVIEFQQFNGRTRETPIRKLEIMGTLPQQVSLSTSTLLQNVWKIPKIQGVRREDIPSYDETTLREVITNSVVHRDYHQLHQPVKIAMFSDRIEVENPGGLLPGLTPLNLLHQRAWRNETIANLMLKAGLGEMDGQGIDRIYGAVRRLKVPAPLIFDQNRTFKIVLSAPKAFEEYSPQEKKLTVIIMLLLEQEIDNESLRNAFGIDAMKTSTLLKELVNEELIYRTTKSMKFAKYRLTESFRKKTEE